MTSISDPDGEFTFSKRICPAPLIARSSNYDTKAMSCYLLDRSEAEGYEESDASSASPSHDHILKTKTDGAAAF